MSHSKRVQEERALERRVDRHMRKVRRVALEEQTLKERATKRSAMLPDGTVLDFYRWDGVVGVSCTGVVF